MIKPKSPPTGSGTTGNETMLAADVNLVASGVGKGCRTEDLKDFLVGKGITPVEVEMLTRSDVIENVRTLTFRVAVKASDYEVALKPEVWPYRVAVRHYRAPKRDRLSGTNTWQGQSRQSGGHIDTHGKAGGGDGPLEAGIGRQVGPHLPPGHSGRANSNQQTMSTFGPRPVELRNLYDVLSALGGDQGPK